jgi:hypothetical protein
MGRNIVTGEESAEICFICSGYIPNNETPGAYPGALSRWDNTTEICSLCGSAEAMAPLVSEQARDLMAEGIQTQQRELWIEGIRLWLPEQYEMNKQMSESLKTLKALEAKEGVSSE